MNILSRSGLLSVLFFSTVVAVSAQSKSYHIYDEFNSKDGFTVLSFSKSMIDAINMTIDEENKKVTGDLNEIRILIANHEKIQIEGSLYKIVSTKFDHYNYRKVEPKDAKEGENVEFWIEGDSKRVKECHVIVRDSDTKELSCLVSFYGNFKVEDLESFEKFSRKQASK